ncbi:ABC transporter ATP-binding protein [Candidatus Micrarchaeota archaeon]|nr:ABC transporter ATP-binding protein [Candidatus Micrarchaeota archaeon]
MVTPVAHAIDVRELTKVINERILVDRISFSVTEGEVYGLLGSSGSGKTTTFRMLTGLLPPSSGSIKYFGVPFPSDSQARLIGFVTQDDSIYPSLSVMQNIEYFASIYGVEGALVKKRANTILEKMDLLDRKNSLASELSGGMRKRLNIAVSIIHDPKIIFFDEPTVGLDPAIRKSVWQIIEELNQSGKTVILTSHYMDEVERLCKKVGIMYRGKMMAKGTVDEIKKKYGIKQMEDIFSQFKAEEI